MQTELLPDGTGQGLALSPPFTTSPRTATVSELVEQSELLERAVRTITPHVAYANRRASLVQLDDFQRTAATRDPLEILNELSGQGWSWRDVAALVGVTVPAITKWRRGGRIAPENRSRLARLSALMSCLTERMISDPVSWLEMPVKEGVTVSKVDLLKRDRFELVLRLATYAGEEFDAEEILDDYDPAWRNRLQDEVFEVATGTDGMPSIQLRS